LDRPKFSLFAGVILSELILITLPIGNPQDITLRALETIRNKDIFFAEDTRNFKKFLEIQNISYENKRIDSFHDHSKNKIEHIISFLRDGSDICLVSDAGSPIISDPAYPLISEAIFQGFKVNTIPGVTSVVTALELSGLPANPFHFWGFISRNSNERISFFNQKLQIKGTHIFFESPHRVYETIDDFFKVYSDGEITVTKELTKTFQTVVRINSTNFDQLKSLIKDKGEFVLLFNTKDAVVEKSINSEILKMTDEYLINPSTKKLAKILSKITQASQEDIYSRLVRSDKPHK
jgi:16S rRNA (cytidine1402-2'-O)-methyltransferase